MSRDTIQLALSEAKKIPYKQGEKRHFAIITDKKGHVVSMAANSYTCTHPVMHKASRKLGMVKDFLHSEVLALLRDKNQRGHKLTVVRIGKNGEPMPSTPCCVCWSLIKEAGHIKCVEWT